MVNADRTPRLPEDFGRHALIALFFAGTVALCYLFVDRPAAVWARGIDPQTVFVFRKITAVGSAPPYLVGLGALFLALRSLRRPAAAQRALFVLTAILVSGLMVDLVKPVVARWRPVAFFADSTQYGFAFFTLGREHNSFPSGHATTIAAVACALALLYPRLLPWCIVAAALVASSRVIVGEHYPGDVLAGAWFGVVITLALSRTARFRRAVTVSESGTPGRRGTRSGGNLGAPRGPGAGV